MSKEFFGINGVDFPAPLIGQNVHSVTLDDNPKSLQGGKRDT